MIQIRTTMIASHQHDFIFIKTRKVGGTSIEIVLGAWCGPGDIVTPISVDDELLRSEFGGCPRNFGAPSELEHAWQTAVRNRDEPSLRGLQQRVKQESRFTNHMPAVEVRQKLPDLWERAFKFTVERHPYEKVISRAWWKLRQHGGDERFFGEVLEEVISSESLSDTPRYLDGDQLIVDEIFPFETMWERIAALGNKIGRKIPDPLPRAKGAHRRDRRPAQEILSTDQKRRIAEACSFEFAYLGYEP